MKTRPPLQQQLLSTMTSTMARKSTLIQPHPHSFLHILANAKRSKKKKKKKRR
jgi:hypothetical protein